MTAPRKLAASVAYVGAICGIGIFWPLYQAESFERRLAEAVKEIRIRANQGDAEARYKLGYSYLKGAGVKQDYVEALSLFRRAADQGNAHAQYSVGLMYRRGQGVPRDDAESARWYLKAAKQGSAYAQTNLGLMYSYGQGVPRDDSEAARLFRSAADQGDAFAQYHLGFAYVGGRGVLKDYSEAGRWFRKAAGQGDAGARYMVGLMYRKGWGVPQSNVESVRWLALGTLSALGWSLPVARLTLIVGLLTGMAILFVPNRRWARVRWVQLAVMFTFFAALLANHLIHSGFSFALLVRGQMGTIFNGPWSVVLDALLAAMTAIGGVGSVVEAARRDGDK